jgi:hypothetical protein
VVGLSNTDTHHHALSLRVQRLQDVGLDGGERRARSNRGLFPLIYLNVVVTASVTKGFRVDSSRVYHVIENYKTIVYVCVCVPSRALLSLA